MNQKKLEKLWKEKIVEKVYEEKDILNGINGFDFRMLPPWLYKIDGKYYNFNRIESILVNDSTIDSLYVDVGLLFDDYEVITIMTDRFIPLVEYADKLGKINNAHFIKSIANHIVSRRNNWSNRSCRLVPYPLENGWENVIKDKDYKYFVYSENVCYGTFFCHEKAIKYCHYMMKEYGFQSIEMFDKPNELKIEFHLKLNKPIEDNR